MGLFARILGALSPVERALSEAETMARPGPPAAAPRPAKGAPPSPAAGRSPGPPPVPARSPADPAREHVIRDLERKNFRSPILTDIEVAIPEADPRTSATDRVFLGHLKTRLTGQPLRLPTIPDVVVRLDEIMRRNDCTVAAVAACVAGEPAIATKLVGVANSPFHGAQRRVNALDLAIGRIGLLNTKDVVWAIALGARMFRVPGWEVETELLHHHAVFSAVWARLIARKRRLDADELFLAGLVHDIGRVVVLSEVADVEHQRRARVTRDLVMISADRLQAPLSALISETWSASPTVVEALRGQRDPDGVADAAAREYAQVMALASALAWSRLSPERAAPTAARVEALELEGALEELGAQAVAITESMGIAVPAAAA